MLMNTDIQVLLVDDDADLRDLLRKFFQERNIAVSVLHDATGLARRLERERPSIVVLDLMMPGVDGLSALRQLRQSGDNVPVIMLSARAEGVDRVLGLEMGADDYLGKPFMPQELLARIHAVLRRHAASPAAAPARGGSAYRFGPFTLDTGTRTLTRGDTPLKLTGTQFALLEVFARHPFEALSRGRLLDLLHGTDADVPERCVDVPVWRLRRLLEADPANPRLIQTLRGVGYRFVPSEDGMADDTHDGVTDAAGA